MSLRSYADLSIVHSLPSQTVLSKSLASLRQSWIHVLNQSLHCFKDFAKVARAAIEDSIRGPKLPNRFKLFDDLRCRAHKYAARFFPRTARSVGSVANDSHAVTHAQAAFGNVAAPLGQFLSQKSQQARQLLCRHSKGVPALPVFCGASNGWLAVAADVNWRMRLLYRLGKASHVRKAVKLPRKACPRFSPQLDKYLEPFVRHFATLLEGRRTDRDKLLSKPSRTDAYEKSAAGQKVHRC